MNLISRCFESIKERWPVGFARRKHGSKSKKEKKNNPLEVNVREACIGTVDGSSCERLNTGIRSHSMNGKLCLDSHFSNHTFVRNTGGGISLGIYEVQRALGAGNQARVLLGWDSLQNDFVALKMVDTEHLNPGYEKHIKNEIRALQTMNHPNILKLRDVFYDVHPTPNVMQCNKALIMVLDFCFGGDLFDIINYTGGFSEQIARTYFKQIVNALSACHDAGIYHRDIKPQNILLNSDFQIKIADFGVCAVSTSCNDKCKTLCGTLSYMAPEIISGCSYSGQKADSWSLGVLLFILLAGSPPLKVAANSDWWFRAIQTCQMALFWQSHERISPEIPTNARTIINRLLVADPNERCTVKDLLPDLWLKGPFLSRNKLKAEMSRRVRLSRAARNGKQQKFSHFNRADWA